MKHFVLILSLVAIASGFSLPSWLSVLWEDDRIIEIDTTTFDWWENGVFYQIYPRSFKDTDGDGIGDLKGITSKIDYLKGLGVTGIVLGPIFASPMVDLGYDVADYMRIDRIFGTEDDLIELLSKAKEQELKIIFDFVPNHSSDQHSWFQQSVRRENGYDNFYIWRTCNRIVDGVRQPVNNWISEYNIPMWTYNAQRNQCYLHQFSSSQPDFNYRAHYENITQEIFQTLTHWMDVGVDGFRMHAINQLYESESFTQEIPINPGGDLTRYDNFRNIFSRDREESYMFMKEARLYVDDYSRRHGNVTRLLMTETFSSIEDTAKWYGEDWNGFSSHLPNNFAFISDITGDTNATVYKEIVDKWMLHMPSHSMGQASWFLGNHDRSRIASRFEGGRHESMAIMSMLLPGVAMIYYGEEIGMTDNNDIAWEDTRDIKALNTNSSVFKEFSRDPQRTPMQWDFNETSFGGFCETPCMPWLPLNVNFASVNVKMQQESAKSTLHLYESLIKLRKEKSVLQKGGLSTSVLGNNVFAFKRTLKDHPTIAVCINFGASESVSLLELLHADDVTERTRATVLLANNDAGTEVGTIFSDLSAIQLGEYEAVVFEVSSAMKINQNAAIVIWGLIYSLKIYAE